MEHFYEMADLRAQLDDAGRKVSADTGYSCFVALTNDYDLEVREQDGVRSEGRFRAGSFPIRETPAVPRQAEGRSFHRR